LCAASPFVMLFKCQKKKAWGHDTAKLQHTSASHKTRISQDLSTYAEESKTCRGRANGHKATLLFPTTSAAVWANHYD
jgi:hypothetical protein